MRRPTASKGTGFDWSQVRARLDKVQAGMKAALEPDPVTIKKLLAERALRLAQPATDEGDTAEELELVLFASGGTRYGIGAESVLRIAPMPVLTPVPGGTSAFLGVVSWPGRILPVTSLEKLSGRSGGGSGEQSMMLVLGGREPEIGLAVDRVDRTDQVSRGAIRTLSEAVFLDPWIKGTLHDGTLLLEGRDLLNDLRLSPAGPADANRMKANGGPATQGGQNR